MAPAILNYWLLYGDFTATGEVFDVGISTTKALRSGKPCIGEHDNGNGSLMRILPLAFVECNDDDIRNVFAFYAIDQPEGLRKVLEGKVPFEDVE